jgi:hypothetical protein
MALYFVTRENVDLNTLPAGTKVIWNEGASAEFDAWRSSVGSQIIVSTLPVAEAPTALVTGVMDVYVTTSLASATTVADNVAGGSLFDEGGTLISETPPADDAPGAPDGGGTHNDFVLIVRQNLGIDDIGDLSVATIGTLWARHRIAGQRVCCTGEWTGCRATKMIQA